MTLHQGGALVVAGALLQREAETDMSKWVLSNYRVIEVHSKWNKWNDGFDLWESERGGGGGGGGGLGLRAGSRHFTQRHIKSAPKWSRYEPQLLVASPARIFLSVTVSGGKGGGALQPLLILVISQFIASACDRKNK